LTTSSRDGPFVSWLKNRKPLLGKAYKYPADYVIELQDVSRKLSGMIAALGDESATSDERKHLQLAQSHVRTALELFEDAQRSSEAAW